MVMLAVASPVFQEYKVPPLAVNVALEPMQIAALTGEMAAVGNEFTVTNLEAVAEQPVPAVTVTE